MVVVVAVAVTVAIVVVLTVAVAVGIAGMTEVVTTAAVATLWWVGRWRWQW
jgi:hypothetical protein